MNPQLQRVPSSTGLEPGSLRLPHRQDPLTSAVADVCSLFRKRPSEGAPRQLYLAGRNRTNSSGGSDYIQLLEETGAILQFKPSTLHWATEEQGPLIAIRESELVLHRDLLELSHGRRVQVCCHLARVARNLAEYLDRKPEALAAAWIDAVFAEVDRARVDPFQKGVFRDFAEREKGFTLLRELGWETDFEIDTCARQLAYLRKHSTAQSAKTIVAVAGEKSPPAEVFPRWVGFVDYLSSSQGARVDFKMVMEQLEARDKPLLSKLGTAGVIEILKRSQVLAGYDPNSGWLTFSSERRLRSSALVKNTRIWPLGLSFAERSALSAIIVGAFSNLRQPPILARLQAEGRLGRANVERLRRYTYVRPTANEQSLIEQELGKAPVPEGCLLAQRHYRSDTGRQLFSLTSLSIFKPDELSHELLGVFQQRCYEDQKTKCWQQIPYRSISEAIDVYQNLVWLVGREGLKAMLHSRPIEERIRALSEVKPEHFDWSWKLPLARSDTSQILRDELAAKCTNSLRWVTRLRGEVKEINLSSELLDSVMSALLANLIVLSTGVDNQRQSREPAGKDTGLPMPEVTRLNPELKEELYARLATSVPMPNSSSLRPIVAAALAELTSGEHPLFGGDEGNPAVRTRIEVVRRFGSPEQVSMAADAFGTSLNPAQATYKQIDTLAMLAQALPQAKWVPLALRLALQAVAAEGLPIAKAQLNDLCSRLSDSELEQIVKDLGTKITGNVLRKLDDDNAYVRNRLLKVIGPKVAAAQLRRAGGTGGNLEGLLSQADNGDQVCLLTRKIGLELEKGHPRYLADQLPNYYAWLGVPVNASADTIRISYRLRSMAFFPDLIEGDLKTRYGNIQKELNLAHEVLSSAEKRADYNSRLVRSGYLGSNNALPQNIWFMDRRIRPLINPPAKLLDSYKMERSQSERGQAPKQLG